MKVVLWLLAIILGSVAFPQQPVRSYLPPAASSKETNFGARESLLTSQQQPGYENDKIPEDSQELKSLQSVEMKEGFRTNGGRLYLPPAEMPKMLDIEIINAEKKPNFSENTVESSSEGIPSLPTSEAQEEVTSTLPDIDYDKKMAKELTIDSDSNSLVGNIPALQQESDSIVLQPDSKTTTEENDSTSTAVEESSDSAYTPIDVDDITTVLVEFSEDMTESMGPQISSTERSEEADTFKMTTDPSSEEFQSDVPEQSTNQHESPDKGDKQKERLEVTEEGPYPYPSRTSEVIENNIEEITDSAIRQSSTQPDELMEQTTKLSDLKDTVPASPVLMSATDKSLLTSDSDILDSQKTLESPLSQLIPSSQEETAHMTGKTTGEAYKLPNNGNHAHSLDDSNAIHGGFERGMNNALSEPDAHGGIFERPTVDKLGQVYYEFSYAVYDPPSGLDFGHQERRQGDNTEGRYYVVLPGGSRQVVTYIADQGGYRPMVRYDGRMGNGFSQATGLNGYTSSPSNQYPQQVVSGDYGGLRQDEYKRTAGPAAFNEFRSTSSTNNHGIVGARPLGSSNFVGNNAFNGYP